ncbi:MAG: PaaI family thioesterase [Nitriliruptoraceae bacterium]|nr:PaaI family thioesterase [Nitriliruptoraceae bacterium]
MSTSMPPDVRALLDRLDAGDELPGDGFEPVLQSSRDAFATGVIGLVYDTFHRDRVQAHAELGPTHQQPYGIVNGGVWCTIVESVASVGAALRVASQGKLAVGVHNSTDFLRSFRAGRVEVTAELVHAGRLQQLWQVVIRRAEDGKTLARGQVRLQVVDAAQLGGPQAPRP